MTAARGNVAIIFNFCLAALRQKPTYVITMIGWSRAVDLANLANESYVILVQVFSLLKHGEMQLSAMPTTYVDERRMQRAECALQVSDFK